VLDGKLAGDEEASKPRRLSAARQI